MLHTTNSKCVIVLGVHRSGTSACAGLLHNLGVNMGTNLLAPNEKNPKGFFEDLDFCRLHHLMIHDWLNPISSTNPYLAEYTELIQSKSKQSLWGLKDPKLCLILPYVINKFKKFNKVYVINMDRPFDQIITSFTSEQFGKKSRYISNENFIDQIFSKEEAEKTTTLYLARKTNFLNNFRGKTLHINYENLIKDTLTTVEIIANFIGMPTTKEALDFIDKGLKHY